MTPIWSKLLTTTLLAAGLVGFAIAADEKPAAKPAEGKIDWSGFVTVSTSTGVVTKVDTEGFSFRIPMPGGKQRPADDLELKYADTGMVRWKTLPKRTDEKGKNIPYTVKEMEEARKPVGTLGFAADRSELKVGHIVEVTLVRPKTILSTKATPADLRIKTAIIVGSDPKLMADGEKEGEKKKK